jgi:hypothetical protein
MADSKSTFILKYAGVAQLVEQLICNQWVGGSIPLAGSNFKLFNGLLDIP